MEYKDTILSRLKNANEYEKKEICKALQIDEASNFETISKEYRSAAGHSFMNYFRGDHELPYKVILNDVVWHLKPRTVNGIIKRVIKHLKKRFGKNNVEQKAWRTDHRLDGETYENKIEEKIEKYLSGRFQEEWNKLNASEQRTKEEELKTELRNTGYSQSSIDSIISVFTSGAVGAVVAPRIALLFAPTISSTTIFGIYIPSFLLSSTGIGLLASIPLLFWIVGGPAYRKTVLATIYMIRIRRRLEGEALL